MGLPVYSGPSAPEDIEFAPISLIDGEPAVTQPGPGGFLGSSGAFSMQDLGNELQDWGGIVLGVGLAILGIGISVLGVGVSLISTGPTGIGLAASISGMVGGGALAFEGFVVALLGAGMFAVGKGIQYFWSDPPRLDYKRFSIPLLNVDQIKGDTTVATAADGAIEGMLLAFSDIHCALAEMEYWQGSQLSGDDEWMKRHDRDFRLLIERARTSLGALTKKSNEVVTELTQALSGERDLASKMDIEFERLDRAVKLRASEEVFDRLASVLKDHCSEVWYLTHAKDAFFSAVRGNPRRAARPVETLLRRAKEFQRLPELAAKI
ncbi:hypothetical protein [uncultured Roseobacter sp.]|uniref:hypothetical protein n=1 Tax=uncultured Roseobacter sp. TaxID=114847 RepID=UPI0026290525|nr:hypothetical protein [uncultured Roseobacter sp.]